MTTEHIDGVSVATKASVYFDGKCISHTITYPDGRKLFLGSTGTGAPYEAEAKPK